MRKNSGVTKGDSIVVIHEARLPIQKVRGGLAHVVPASFWLSADAFNLFGTMSDVHTCTGKAGLLSDWQHVGRDLRGAVTSVTGAKSNERRRA